MPLNIPTLDDRSYQQLRDEALARIPVHNPEWTNFNRSDPGVTLIELFAFLTESLLYRSNQIPERNRRKFLAMLDIPLQPATAARGLVTIANERGPLRTITLNTGVEVRAGQVPFRTTSGLDVLPIEARIFYKRELQGADESQRSYYEQLYASFVADLNEQNFSNLTQKLYETLPFPTRGGAVDISRETVDKSLWIALLARPHESVEDARKQIGGKTLSLGIVPALQSASDTTRTSKSASVQTTAGSAATSLPSDSTASRLAPSSRNAAEQEALLEFLIPSVPAGGRPLSVHAPKYQPLTPRTTVDVLSEPGIIEITLPKAEALVTWYDLDPLEAGAGDLPPAIEDTDLEERVITWLRISAASASRAALLWAGINVVGVVQRAEVAAELLPAGTGAPDQVVTLAHAPVLAETVQIGVTSGGRAEQWEQIEDLLQAGPEVPTPDLRQPPGSSPRLNLRTKVFVIDAEAGRVRFGDGTRGARPPYGAILRASYAYSEGGAGNLGAGAISGGPALPAGMKVTNPLPTWGGAAAETVGEGEKQMARYVQHRDRLVSATDFETIVLRTPGVVIGRVEVLAAFHPELSPNEPGDAPGTVTLLLIPRNDPEQPDAPRPDQLFLNTICTYLDTRRLVTTEIFLRGPRYKGIWVSIGIDVVAGMSVAEVREAVKKAVLAFLAPLPEQPDNLLETQSALVSTPQGAAAQRGWPLRKPVVAQELLAVASRVAGVLLVNSVQLAEGDKSAEPQVSMKGLELPRVLGITVRTGDPQSLSELRGQASVNLDTTDTTTVFLPVPVIPEECR